MPFTSPGMDLDDRKLLQAWARQYQGLQHYGGYELYPRVGRYQHVSLDTSWGTSTVEKDTLYTVPFWSVLANNPDKLTVLTSSGVGVVPNLQIGYYTSNSTVSRPVNRILHAEAVWQYKEDDHYNVHWMDVPGDISQPGGVIWFAWGWHGDTDDFSCARVSVSYTTGIPTSSTYLYPLKWDSTEDWTSGEIPQNPYSEGWTFVRDEHSWMIDFANPISPEE